MRSPLLPMGVEMSCHTSHVIKDPYPKPKSIQTSVGLSGWRTRCKRARFLSQPTNLLYFLDHWTLGSSRLQSFNHSLYSKGQLTKVSKENTGLAANFSICYFSKHMLKSSSGTIISLRQWRLVSDSLPSTVLRRKHNLDNFPVFMFWIW